MLEPENSTVIADLEARKRTAPNGTDYWMARELQPILGYANWQNFESVIQKAKMACRGIGMEPDNQFIDTSRLMETGKGAKLSISDYILSRYACYLIAMNGESSKIQIATAQSYFAVQTRRQEQTDALEETEKRILLRDRVRSANRNLSGVARKAGVRDFGLFHDAGYRGLYGGLGLADIKRQKNIPDREDLLDCSGRVELAANEFRITQTEQKLTREQIVGQLSAINTHHAVGKEVRDTIRRIGGKKPENLPAEKPIKKLISETSKKQKALKKGVPLLPDPET